MPSKCIRRIRAARVVRRARRRRRAASVLAAAVLLPLVVYSQWLAVKDVAEAEGTP